LLGVGRRVRQGGMVVLADTPREDRAAPEGMALGVDSPEVVAHSQQEHLGLVLALVGTDRLAHLGFPVAWVCVLPSLDVWLRINGVK
jgi:hypothetical protein